MKGMDIFCASQAATAICLSMDDHIHPSSSILVGAGSSSPAIDRCNPIITDSRRLCNPPPSSKPPHKIKTKAVNKDDKIQVKINAGRKSWSCTNPGAFISPPGSTRYLLGDNALSQDTSNNPVQGNQNESCQPPQHHQVVVLRVSLHCRGCERKMRKHISRMEGVTSFDIDFAAKKVTVSGKITPTEVLSSISKVKNAQLWSPTMALPTYTNLNYFKNGYKGGNSNNNNNGAY